MKRMPSFSPSVIRAFGDLFPRHVGPCSGMAFFYVNDLLSSHEILFKR